MKAIVIIESLYSKKQTLISIENKIKTLEMRFLFRKLKNLKEYDIDIYCHDKTLVDYLNSKGYNAFYLSEEKFTDEDLKRITKKITDKFYRVFEVKNLFKYKNYDFSSVMKHLTLPIVYDELKKINLYENLIDDYDLVISSSPLSIEGKLLNSICFNKGSTFSSFLPKFYYNFQNFLLSIYAKNYFRNYYFNNLKLFKSISPKKKSGKILVIGEYINYLKNIVPTVEKNIITKGHEIYYLAKENDLRHLNVDFTKVSEFNIKKIKIKPEQIDRILNESKKIGNIFEYKKINFFNAFYGEFKNLIEIGFPYILSNVNQSLNILNNLNPKILLVGDDRSYVARPMVIVAKSQSIPTIEIQHGIFKDPELMVEPISEKICVWGEYHKNILLAAGAFENSLVVTGCPIYDSLHLVDCSNENNKILLVTQPSYFQISKQVIERFTKINTNLLLQVKPHPREDVNDYKIYEKKFPGKVSVKDVNENTARLISKSDLIIVFDSTLTIEAAILGKPIISVNLGTPSLYVKEGLATDLKELKDLEKVIDEVMSQKNVEVQEVNRHVFKFAYKIDGLAKDRVCNVIMELLN